MQITAHIKQLNKIEREKSTTFSQVKKKNMGGM